MSAFLCALRVLRVLRAPPPEALVFSGPLNRYEWGSRATLGEISDTLRKVWGTYRAV